MAHPLDDLSNPSSPTGDYHPATTGDYSPGDRIGPYKLLDRLGHGGMGTVWLAEQSEPIHRRVALKLIKAGMDTQQVLSRFEAERQALALMDHPNIAKVFDAGRTDAGRPFFVMELVKGTPVTTFCDTEKLSLRERLELFIPICQAVQHAHQKGIIHRDLKPSNILVTLIDGKPVPKIIDFGVAKAMHQKLTEQTLYTAVGMMVGTPEYMAPEQAKVNNVDIDTRADVYSLGVVLYELLAGSPPFASHQLREAAYDEMLRIIREVDPPKPSTKLSSSDELPSIAARRKLEPTRLSKQVQGELDWITMKCLEKERARRYETANGLAMDIQRYLSNEPVLAGPPSATYRIRKFVRRNRGPVIAVSSALVILSILVVGLIGTTAAAIRNMRRANQLAVSERLAKQDAQEKEQKAVTAADKEREARLEEERQRKFAEGINRFVVDDFLALTSLEGQDRFGGEGKEELNKDTTLQQLLDRAAKKLRTRKDLEPRIEAQLCWIIGVNYRANGQSAQAVELLERAVQIRCDHLGRDHVDTLDAMNSLGVAHNVAGQFHKALPLLEATLAGREAKLGTDDRDTLKTRRNLAWAYHAVGQRGKALSMYETVVKVAEAKLGSDDPQILIHRADLAHAYLNAGKLDKAVPLYEATLTATEAKLGAYHPGTLSCRGDLAMAYYLAGQRNKALSLLEANLKAKEGTLGANHTSTLTSRNNLAMAYQDAGLLDKALPLLEATLKAREATLGADHPDTLTSRSNLAIAYANAGLLDKALPLFEATLRAREATQGADHPDTLASRNNLASSYQAAGQLDKALPLLEATLKAFEAKLGADHPSTMGTMGNLGAALLQAKRYMDAEAVMRRLLKMFENRQPNGWNSFYTKSKLGEALIGQEKYAEAEPLLVSGYEGMKQRFDQIPANSKNRLVDAAERLIQLYDAWGRPDEAAKWRKELEEQKQRLAQKKPEPKSDKP